MSYDDAAAARPQNGHRVRRLRLAGEPASAGTARRELRALLEAEGRAAWLEAAELACTEVVANAVLHAHTPIDLTLTLSPDQLRVEVRDFSPVLPLQRLYGGEATTGRGMALVAALADEHGISDVDGTGKTVWFTISGFPQEQSEDELLAAWDDAGWDTSDTHEPLVADDDTATVTLRRLPPALWLAAREHHDALIRELQLYLAEHELDEVDVPATDVARALISSTLVATLGDVADPLQRDTPIHLRPAVEPLDLALRVPLGLGPAFSAMQDTLDAAERLAQAALLLVSPGLPEIVAVRDWACEQITAQLAGIPPTAWLGTDQERFTVTVHGRTAEPEPDGWDVAAVRDADVAVVAGDDANRIIAVSKPLAELVGWTVDELVGRRIVTLVPGHLREAHVAGFTRHLTTGEAHVLDVPLTLPVLHRDGREIPCRFLIQRATSPGRPVYVAWVEPQTS